VAQKLDAREMATVPADAPTYFVPAALGAALIDGKGRFDRRVL
jgi:hypothetical protein